MIHQNRLHILLVTENNWLPELISNSPEKDIFELTHTDDIDKACRKIIQKNFDAIIVDHTGYRELVNLLEKFNDIADISAMIVIIDDVVDEQNSSLAKTCQIIRAELENSTEYMMKKLLITAVNQKKLINENKILKEMIKNFIFAAPDKYGTAKNFDNCEFLPDLIEIRNSFKKGNKVGNK